MARNTIISTTKAAQATHVPELQNKTQQGTRVTKSKKSYQKLVTDKVNESSDKMVKRVKKHHHIAVHAAFFIAIASLLVLGNQSQNEGSEVAYSVGLGGSVSATVDEVSSADVAATIARGANLLIADNVQNLADSLNAQVEFASGTESVVSKPQIVATDAKTKQDIQNYVAQDGEDVQDIARRFNVTSNTVRWANNIDGDFVAAGTKLKILPVSGILYTVGSGDTAGSIAREYSANKEQIIAFNDAELSGLKKGTKIVIPNGEEPAPAAPAYFTGTTTSSPAASSAGFAFGNQPLYGGNGYSYGYCTWHVANRRLATGKSIPRNLGNAVTWASVAGASGLGVGEDPRQYAVLWHKNTYIAGGYGHVGFVEEIKANGDAIVSDMNYGGWNVITTRVIPKSEFSQYLFIY